MPYDYNLDLNTICTVRKYTLFFNVYCTSQYIGCDLAGYDIHL